MIDSLAVIVPARDEQDEIRGCLQSLTVARNMLLGAASRPVSVRIVVVLDDCRDATAEVVAEFPCVEVVTCGHGLVGAARQAGADYVLDGQSCRTLWLANTDADCQVPADWLVNMLAHADAGADLVLGTVQPAAGLPDALMRAWLAAHDHQDDHPHVHGANLGIRATCYAELGGWSPLASHEDVDLVRRAERSGQVVIRRTGALMVTTSNRRLGRAPRGFANYLTDLEAAIGEAG